MTFEINLTYDDIAKLVYDVNSKKTDTTFSSIGVLNKILDKVQDDLKITADEIEVCTALLDERSKKNEVVDEN